MINQITLTLTLIWAKGLIVTGDYIRRDEVALMLFARIPSIRPGPNPSVQRR